MDKQFVKEMQIGKTRISYYREKCPDCLGCGFIIEWHESGVESPPIGVQSNVVCPTCKGRGAIETEEEVIER